MFKMEWSKIFTCLMLIVIGYFIAKIFSRNSCEGFRISAITEPLCPSSIGKWWNPNTYPNCKCLEGCKIQHHPTDINKARCITITGDTACGGAPEPPQNCPDSIKGWFDQTKYPNCKCQMKGCTLQTNPDNNNQIKCIDKDKRPCTKSGPQQPCPPGMLPGGWQDKPLDDCFCPPGSHKQHMHLSPGISPADLYRCFSCPSGCQFIPSPPSNGDATDYQYIEYPEVNFEDIN